MSIKVMNLVWENAPYQENTLLTLLALADWSSEAGVSWPSMETLAKKSRQSVRNAQRTIKRLEKDGVLSVEYRKDNSSLYTINLKKISLGQNVTPAPTGDTGDTEGVTLEAENVSQMSPNTSIEPSLEPSLSLSELRSDVPDMKEKANKAVNILFAFYLEKLGRDPKKYTLTDKRKQQGLSRLRECFKKTGDLDGAILLMKDAIRKLAASDFHRQGKYVEWGDNLFKSAEKLEYWLNRDAVAPSAPPQGRDDLADIIRQRGGPDALKRRHAERTGG